VAYGARLESVLGASPRGFESPILRQTHEHIGNALNAHNTLYRGLPHPARPPDRHPAPDTPGRVTIGNTSAGAGCRSVTGRRAEHAASVRLEQGAPRTVSRRQTRCGAYSQYTYRGNYG
jgi:hypothetical protein